MPKKKSKWKSNTNTASAQGLKAFYLFFFFHFKCCFIIKVDRIVIFRSNGMKSFKAKSHVDCKCVYGRSLKIKFIGMCVSDSAARVRNWIRSNVCVSVCVVANSCLLEWSILQITIVLFSYFSICVVSEQSLTSNAVCVFNTQITIKIYRSTRSHTM